MLEWIWVNFLILKIIEPHWVPVNPSLFQTEHFCGM